VGLDDVKKMLYSVRNSVEVQAKRKEFGVKEDMCLHMLLLGNPVRDPFPLKSSAAFRYLRLAHCLRCLHFFAA
jgi:hypothetical protein